MKLYGAYIYSKIMYVATRTFLLLMSTDLTGDGVYRSGEDEISLYCVSTDPGTAIGEKNAKLWDSWEQ